MIPLRVMVALFVAMIALLGWWTYRDTRPTGSDGRTEIVAWGITFLGEDVYGLVNRFEQENPQFKVIISSSAERDSTSDSQRLLCAIAGGVPPDVVFFSRFATGEWASRGALADLSPLIAQQDRNDPRRIDLSEYFPWALAEGSYKNPGSDGPNRIYGIPTTGDIRILYVNPNILRQEGLVDESGNPRPPRTWEELRDYTNRLTTFRTRGEKSSGIARLGFAPNFGNSWLYLYAWQAGGGFLSKDRTRVTMDSPPVRRALQFMSDLTDDVGGLREISKFQDSLAGESTGGSFRASLGGGDLDPFLRGLVAMKIDNDYALRTIAEWKPDMDFLIAPPPMPADELAKGRKPVTWAGGFSLVIPETSRSKQGAFKLIQFLTSWEATQLLEQGKRERRQSEGRMYLPEGYANRIYSERLIKQYIFDDPRVPKTFKDAYTVINQLTADTLTRPVTPVGQLLWNKHVSAYESAVSHQFAQRAREAGMDEVSFALQDAQKEVQRQLDEALTPPSRATVHWGPFFAAYIALLALPFVAMYGAYCRKRRSSGYRAREIGAAMLFLSPWVVGFAVFVGGPILFSVLISFARYDAISEAHYVGWDNYRRVFTDDTFYKSVGNTMFMLMRVPLMMAVSLVIALVLNRSIRAIGFYRTAFYMPAIVPMVAASLLWAWLFNPVKGPINGSIEWLIDTRFAHWIESLLNVKFLAPLWLNDPAWSKPALILMSLWNAGAGIVIWLAGLQAIPPQLYEAASIDGAGTWRRFWHITVPMLSPYILFNAIIGVIGTMQIFGEAYIMTSGGPQDSTLFYAYDLFKQAFQYFRMGYASALAWILFLIVLALTLVQLWLSRKWVHYEQG
ncbi:hypothetical protein BH09PLA1_BH09PLA1_06090 [soil metagenome]